MGQYKKFWYLLVAVLVGAFSILGYYGFEVYREAPPIPQQYVSHYNFPVPGNLKQKFLFFHNPVH